MAETKRPNSSYYNELKPEDYITDSLINPCPSPKDLGLSCKEYRINEYEQLLRSIWRKYIDKIGILFIIILFCVWCLGMEILTNIFNEGFFFRKILGNGIAILWSWFLIKSHDPISEIACDILTKWKFKKLNSKKPLTEMIHFDNLSLGYEKFQKEELSQIKQYISFRDKYESAVSTAKDTISQTLKKKK